MFIVNKNIIKTKLNYIKNNIKYKDIKFENIDNLIQIKPNKDIQLTFNICNVKIDDIIILNKSKIQINIKKNQIVNIHSYSKTLNITKIFKSIYTNSSIKIKELENYDSLIINYKKDYNCDIINDFNYFCYYYKNKISVKLNNPNENYECIIINFDNEQHFEFIIKSNINKLYNWNFTIVCCDDNYEFIKNIVNTIEINIKIIKIIKDEFNNILYDIHFWKLFDKKNILIIDNNCLIIDADMNDYIQYDYSYFNNNAHLINKYLIIEILNNLLLIDDNFNNWVKNKLNKNKIFNNIFYYNNQINFKNNLFNKLIKNNESTKINKSIKMNESKLKIITNQELSIEILNNFDLFVNTNDEYIYLYIYDKFELNVEQINLLYENYKTSYSIISSPVIINKENKLEYFGAVNDNDGNIIMINEDIIKYMHVETKNAWNSYIQNTMIPYPTFFISSNYIENILNIKDILNVKIDPFVVVKCFADTPKYKLNNYNNYDINLDYNYLKDIYNSYSNLNLISSKFFDNYYLTMRKDKYILIIEDSPITPDCDCGSLYIYYYLKTLLKQNYIVHFIPLNFYNNPKYTEMLNKMGIYQCYGYPYSVEYHIKNNHNVYDYIFISRLSAIRKSFDIVKKYCINSKIIFITHDLSHLRLERENKLDKNVLTKIKNEELYYINNCDISIVVSQYEYELLNNYDKIYYSPICYKIEDDYNRNNNFTKDIYFIGSSHPPNLDAVNYFIETHWKNLFEKLKINLHIIGKGFDKYKNYSNDGIIVHGFVEDDKLNKLIKKCRINIVPLRFGAGIKGKILQSANLKIPCISSKIGAEGMNFKHESEIIIIDFDDINFIDDFINYYNNIELLNTISNNSYKCMKDNYSLEKNEEYINNMMKKLI